MKTIEQKAKAYDEAIERVKSLLSDNQLGNAWIYKLLPELKESEDERIRKKVIDVLKLNVRGAESQMQASRGVDRTFEVYACNKVISWLEKQGENHIVGNNEMVKPIDKVEQKPVVYIPKFHVGDKLVSTYNTSLTYEVLEVGHINGLGNPDYKVEIFTDGKAENPRNIHYMECYKVDEWAKLIEQKHAWSEEDETRLKNAIMYCEWARDKAPDLPCYETSEKSIDWLKSLKQRYTWKPSDSQMRALEYIINNTSNTSYSCKIAKELLEQLKKLKGKEV